MTRRAVTGPDDRLRSRLATVRKNPKACRSGCSSFDRVTEIDSSVRPRIKQSTKCSKGQSTMRFMMLMIPKGYEKATPGTMPDPKAVEAMMKYNKFLQKAGVLMSLDGLRPQSEGARVS